MTYHIIEVDYSNIITHNKYYKCIIRCISNCTGHHNRVTNFEKCHVFSTLNLKLYLKKHKPHALLSLNLMHLCHTLFAFCKKNFNFNIPKDELF